MAVLSYGRVHMIKGFLLSLLAAVSWGVAIVMSKKGLESLDAGGLFFWQTGGAMTLSWIVFIISKKKLPLTRKTVLACATGIFEPFLAYTLTLYGLSLVPAGIVSVIFSLESVFILVLSVICFSVKIHNPYYFISLLFVTIIGNMMVVFPDISTRANSTVGYVFVIAGVLSAAFYVVISSRLVEDFEPVALLAGQLTFSFILSSVFIQISGSSLRLPAESVFIVFSSGILQYFLAFCFYLYSLRWLSAHIAGIMLYFIPVVSLILSCFFLQEEISVIQGVGVIVTIMAVCFINKRYADVN